MTKVCGSVRCISSLLYRYNMLLESVVETLQQIGWFSFYPFNTLAFFHRKLWHGPADSLSSLEDRLLGWLQIKSLAYFSSKNVLVFNSDLKGLFSGDESDLDITQHCCGLTYEWGKKRKDPKQKPTMSNSALRSLRVIDYFRFPGIRISLGSKESMHEAISWVI